MTAVRTALLISALGVGLTALGLYLSPTLAASSILLAFAFWSSAAMGSLLLVAAFNAAGTTWVTLLRRQLEHQAAALIPCACAFVLLAVDLPRLYVWTADAGPGRRGWLNEPGWIARGAIVFALFLGLWLLLDRNTRAQEKRSPDAALKRQTRELSSGALVFLVLGLAVAGVDWLMSLEPGWSSAAFGLYFASGSVTAGLALLTLSAVRDPKVTGEHLSVLSALLLLATCATALLGLSQAAIIGGSHLPADSGWLAVRLGVWRPVAVLLVVGHFAVPLVALVDTVVRGNRKLLTATAMWLLAMRFVDLLLLIKPALRLHDPRFSAPEATIGFTDLTALAGLGGLCVLFVQLRMRGRATVPVNDPSLEASLQYRAPVD